MSVRYGVLATLAVEKPVLRLRDRLLPAKDHATVGAAPSTAPVRMPARQEDLARLAA